MMGYRAGAAGDGTLLAASGNQTAELALPGALGNTGVAGLWVYSFGATAPIDGTTAGDTLAGTPGGDTVHGLGGNDVLLGSAGADVLDGGTGIDRVDYSAAPAAVVIERDLPGLGVVRIKQLSVAEYDDVRGRTKADAPASEFGLALTAYALVDDAGHPLLSQGDLQPLRAAAGTKVDALVGAVLDVNGYKRAGSPN